MKISSVFKYNNEVYKVIYTNLESCHKRSVLCRDPQSGVYTVFINTGLSEEERQKELHIVLKRKKDLREITLKDYTMIKKSIEDIQYKIFKAEEDIQIKNIEDNFIRYFNKLNKDGKSRLYSYISDLIGIDKYTKKELVKEI